MFFAYACVFYFAYNLKEEKWQVLLLKIFVVFTIIISILIYIDPFGKIFPSFFKTYPYTGMFINSNHYGYFLCLAIPISFGLSLFEKKLWQKILFILNTASLIVQLLLNNSYGPAIALFITLLTLPFAYRLFMRKWNFQTFIPIVFFLASALLIKNIRFYDDTMLTIKQLVGIVTNDSNSISFGTGRIELWLHSLNLIIQNPIFGIGLGNFTLNGKHQRPHNEYLQHAVSTGILGLLLYLSALVVIAIRLIKNRKETSPLTFITGSAIFCYLISAFFGNTMTHVMPFFVTILAFLTYSIKPFKKIK